MYKGKLIRKKKDKGMAANECIVNQTENNEMTMDRLTQTLMTPPSLDDYSQLNPGFIGGRNISPVLDETFRLHMEHNLTYEEDEEYDEDINIQNKALKF